MLKCSEDQMNHPIGSLLLMQQYCCVIYEHFSLQSFKYPSTASLLKERCECSQPNYFGKLITPAFEIFAFYRVMDLA
jgi:hypothetical protein